MLKIPATTSSLAGKREGRKEKRELKSLCSFIDLFSPSSSIVGKSLSSLSFFFFSTSMVDAREHSPYYHQFVCNIITFSMREAARKVF